MSWEEIPSTMMVAHGEPAWAKRQKHKLFSHMELPNLKIVSSLFPRSTSLTWSKVVASVAVETHCRRGRENSSSRRWCDLSPTSRCNSSPMRCGNSSLRRQQKKGAVVTKEEGRRGEGGERFWSYLLWGFLQNHPSILSLFSTLDKGLRLSHMNGMGGILTYDTLFPFFFLRVYLSD